MLLRLIEVILPVLICAGIGYGWARSGRPFDTRMVTRLVTNIGTPCLIVATLTGLRLESDAFFTMAGAALLSISVFFVIAYAITRLAGDDFRTYGPPLGFANAGNLGLPLCLFAFGDAGLALAIAYFAVGAVGQFTVGQFIVAGRLVSSPRWPRRPSSGQPGWRWRSTFSTGRCPRPLPTPSSCSAASPSRSC